MDNNIFEYWQKFGASTVAATRELETINSKVWSKLGGQQMELANAAVETGARYVGALSEAPGVETLMAEQNKAYVELNERFASAVRESTELLAAARDEYQAWFEKGLSDLALTPITDMPLATPRKPGGKKAA